MSDRASRTFSQDFKLFFLRGLVVLLPSILTLWIIVKAYQFVDDTIAEPINGGVRWVIRTATPHVSVLSGFRPSEDEVALRLEQDIPVSDRDEANEAMVTSTLTKENIEEWWGSFWFGALDLIGILVAITAVYFAGRLLGGFFGRKIYRRVEKAITTVPGIKQVYPYVKQVVDFLFGEDKQIEFKRVVLVEYPRKGIYAIGLLTGSALKSISQKANSDSVTVFIPSSPTPFTGYTITIPRAEAMDLPISIEEALRFTISAGVLMPDRESLPPGVDPTKVAQPSTPTGAHGDVIAGALTPGVSGDAAADGKSSPSKGGDSAAP